MEHDFDAETQVEAELLREGGKGENFDLTVIISNMTNTCDLIALSSGNRLLLWKNKIQNIVQTGIRGSDGESAPTAEKQMGR